MHIALVNSRLDPAGKNIRYHLRELLGNPDGKSVEYGSRRYTFLETEGRLIHVREIDACTDADLIIFISRHASKNPVPTLTVHVTGNIGEAEVGGDPRSLSTASPEWMHAILRALRRHEPPGYRTSYEVTHHGPTDVHTPSLFVEIGSTETEWTDPAAGRAVAASILEAEPGSVIRFIGFGGNHYAARQTAMALSTRAAWGHIAHSREVPLLSGEMIRDMQGKSRAHAAYIDRKSLKKRELRRLESLLDKAGLLCLSESEIRELGAIDWPSYRTIRDLAASVAPGSRIHLHHMAGPMKPVPLFLDPALLEEAIRLDEERFLQELGSLVHLSSEDGKILPIFIVYEKNRSEQIHDLISSCVKIIIQSENTAVEKDRLILRKMRFDPTLARDLGVPQGPLFGRLAAGHEITINGKVISPEKVSVCSERVIQVPGLERYV